MENTFQLVQVRFKNPRTEEEFEGFCIAKSFMSPAEFEKLFNADDDIPAVLLPPKVSAPMKLDDAAAFEEVKDLMESLSTAIERLDR